MSDGSTNPVIGPTLVYLEYSILVLKSVVANIRRFARSDAAFVTMVVGFRIRSRSEPEGQ